jgi:hypothetical protein
MVADNTGEGPLSTGSGKARPTMCQIPQLLWRGARGGLRGKVVTSCTVESQLFLLEVDTPENISPVNLFCDQLSYTKDMNVLN